MICSRECLVAAVEHLERARKLIERPECWTRGATRRTSLFGTHSYCMLGAIYSARVDGRLGEEEGVATDELIDAARVFGFGPSVASLNDQFLTHDGVLWFYDVVIARLKAKAAHALARPTDADGMEVADG